MAPAFPPPLELEFQLLPPVLAPGLVVAGVAAVATLAAAALPVLEQLRLRAVAQARTFRDGVDRLAFARAFDDELEQSAVVPVVAAEFLRSWAEGRRFRANQLENSRLRKR
jgi:hypothetical protein